MRPRARWVGARRSGDGTAAGQSSFETGFVLAGAVSAGCHSAGVMDFMIGALDDHHAGRGKGGWDGPKHDGRAPVLAGASAGGMTAGMAGLHAFRDLAHVWPGRSSAAAPAAAARMSSRRPSPPSGMPSTSP